MSGCEASEVGELFPISIRSISKIVKQKRGESRV